MGPVTFNIKNTSAYTLPYNLMANGGVVNVEYHNA